MDVDEWEDLGVFERNKRTGERRLKRIAGGLPTAEMAAEEPSVLGEFAGNMKRAGRQVATGQFVGSVGRGMALNTLEALAPIQAVRGAQRLGLLDDAPESLVGRLEASHRESREGFGPGVAPFGTAAEMALDPMNLAVGAGLSRLAKPAQRAVSPALRELSERSLRIAPEINESLLAERRVNAPLRDAVEKLLPSVRRSTDLKALAETAERDGNEALMRAVERVTMERPSGTSGFNVVSDQIIPQTPEGHAVSNVDPDLPSGGFFREWFTSRRNLPEFAHKANYGAMARVSALDAEANLEVREINRQLRQTYGFFGKDKKQQALGLIDRALEGDTGALKSLPEGFHPPVLRARALQDRLSKQAIDSGLVEGEMVETFRKNLGTYMRRSFRAFDDPNWQAKVQGTEIWNAAKGRLLEEHPEKTPEWAEGWLRNWVKRDPDTVGRIGGAGLARKDLSIFERKAEIPEELLKVLGEEKDPRINILRSVHKLAQSIETHEALTSIRDQGLGRIFHPGPMNEFSAQINSEALGPLNGLWTKPEVAQGINEAYEATKGGTWAAINGLVKFGKTAGNIPQGMFRNFLGNPLLVTFNGVPPNFLSGRAYKMVGGAVNPELRDAFLRGHRMGLFGESPNYKEIEQYGDWVSGFLSKSVGTSETGAKLVKGIKEFGYEKPGQLYRGADDYWRVVRGEAEYRAYKKALPNAPEEGVEGIVRDILRETHPTYSQAPKAVDWLRKNSVVSPFPTFWAEVVRSAKGTIVQAAREIQNPNPAIRAIGYRRAAGTVMTGTGIAAVPAMARLATGTTKDEEQAIREFVPEYHKSSDLVLMRRGKGRYSYMDFSFMNPYQDFAEAGRALLAGDPMRAIGIVAAPYTSPEITVQAGAEMLTNTTQWGGEIRHPSDTGLQQGVDLAAYGARKLAPGAVLRGQEIFRATTGKSEGAREYSVPGALSALLGFRVSTLNVPRALESYGKHLQSQRADVKDSFREDVRGKKLSPQDVTSRQTQAQENWRRIFDEARLKVEAARKLGMSDQEIRSAFKGRVNQAMIEGLLRGRFVPVTFDPEDVTVR